MEHRVKFCTIAKSDIYRQICVATQKGEYIAYIRGKRCRTEESFFAEISASFQFPYYFGENWAAMDECLCDLEWLHVRRIFVIIDDFSCMFSGQEQIQNILQKRVIKYLDTMIDYWKEQHVVVEVWLNN